MSNIRLSAVRYPHIDGAIVHCVLAAGDAYDRLHDVPRLPYVRINPPYAPVSQSPVAGGVAEFDGHERALFRALRERFPPDKCVEMVLRARKAQP